MADLCSVHCSPLKRDSRSCPIESTEARFSDSYVLQYCKNNSLLWQTCARCMLVILTAFKESQESLPH
jgi:hypothetical protein